MIQKGDAGLEIDKERYKRNILLPEVGEEGQKKLADFIREDYDKAAFMTAAN